MALRLSGWIEALHHNMLMKVRQLTRVGNRIIFAHVL
jgi:hypothetical protein